jgi:hypothetical protein
MTTRGSPLAQAPCHWCGWQSDHPEFEHRVKFVCRGWPWRRRYVLTLKCYKCRGSWDAMPLRTAADALAEMEEGNG